MANIEFHEHTATVEHAAWHPEAVAPFSATHADLLDMFERWEVIADAGSAPRIDVAERVNL